MRTITTHHDGHGLNEAIEIVADELGPGGASHHYNVTYRKGEIGTQVADVQFQKGPRDIGGSTPGVTDVALLAIVRDRVEAFQAGEFACQENAMALEGLIMAMDWMRIRADNRADRGVLGTYAK